MAAYRVSVQLNTMLKVHRLSSYFATVCGYRCSFEHLNTLEHHVAVRLVQTTTITMKSIQ